MKLQLNPGNDKQNNIWIVLLVSDKNIYRIEPYYK